jgi:hypothetical protein
MFIFIHHNAGQNYNTEIENRSFENVAELNYLGRTLTDQNCFNEELKAD